MSPTLKKKKTQQNEAERTNSRGVENEKSKREKNIYFFLLFNFFSDSRKSDCWNLSGKKRKLLYATRATCGYQKHKISPRIQVKIRKNPKFWFFSNLRHSSGQNFRTQS